MEEGVLPLTGGAATKANWDLIKMQAQQGLIEQIDARAYVQYYNALHKIAADNAPIPETLDWANKCSPNLWYWGPTGTGKSRKVRN